jgi:hypothetical protein
MSFVSPPAPAAATDETEWSFVLPRPPDPEQDETGRLWN